VNQQQIPGESNKPKGIHQDAKSNTNLDKYSDKKENNIKTQKKSKTRVRKRSNQTGKKKGKNLIFVRAIPGES